MEAMVGNAHHIEVQLIADGQGTAWAARRARLLLPAPPPEGRRGVLQPGAHARAGGGGQGRRRARLALESGYRNAGTVEFLYEPEHERFSLHGGQRAPAGRAPRDRGGHRRSTSSSCSCTSRPAARSRASRPRRVGHAIEARLNAEDPAMRLRADAGPRRSCSTSPAGPGIRVDRGIADRRRDPARLRLDGRQGDRPRPHARRGDRAPAPRAARDARRSSRTARPTARFLLALLDRAGVPRRRGRHRLARPPRRVRRDGVRRTAPTPRCCRPRSSSPTTRPRPSARASTPTPAAAARRPSAAGRRTVEVRHRGQAYRIVVSQLAPGRYRAEVDGTARRGDGRAPQRARAPDHDRRPARTAR